MQPAEHVMKGLGRTLAIAARAATFGLGLAACGDDTKNTDTTGGSVTSVTAPKGTVTGQIVDTNGNPISGATVYIADGAVGTAAAKVAAVKSGKIKPKASVTTNTAGQFTITNVVAQNVANSGGSDTASAYNLPIQIFVDSPAGYLDATIQVKPQAQVVNDQPGTITGGQTNAPIVFIDGFVASTGTVKVPALTTKVVGTLRDAATGAPISGADLTLDYRDLASDQNPDQTTTAVTYATSILVSTTAADGSFEFLNVADDSDYQLAAPLYSLTQGVNTDTEGAHTVVLGDINVSPITSADTINPYVEAVEKHQVGTDRAASFARKGADAWRDINRLIRIYRNCCR